MKQAIAEHFPASVEIWEAGGGLYFWARLPRTFPTGVKSKVFQTALKNDVLYVPGELCYADDPSRPNRITKCASASAARARKHPRRHPAAGQGFVEVGLK